MQIEFLVFGIPMIFPGIPRLSNSFNNRDTQSDSTTTTLFKHDSGDGAVGGAGLPNSITGSSATYSVGGDCTDFDGNISAGGANTGDGGDGGYPHATPSGQAGGSGIVIVRYIL